ncbi:hypothetical protein C8F04DRAFT_1321119 [Mycena alexandri]|uniref:Uncharacterized protein n=1 Tax=Mycena alexandri TaxID=1745969 RepID=A0AAD6WSY2_9AGAR|nr:hypothetical protein C8F04DRAFT_1321119 [Mycena alexandri]
MSVYQQSQRGQSYTFTTHDEWLASVPDVSSPSPADPGPASDSRLDPADFADSLCNTLGLNAKYRSDLQTFVNMLTGSRDDRIAMVYLMATNLYTQQIVLDGRADYAAIAELLQDVKAALSQNLDFTKEQRTEITLGCKIKVWDPKRIDFDNDAIRHDVLSLLKSHKNSNGLKAVFDAGGARVKTLGQFIGLQASYAKSIFRNHIRDSLSGCVTLATTGAMRKLVGSTENITPVHAMRMLVLRHFARENKELLGPVQESNKRARVGEPGDADNRKPTRGTDSDSWWPQVTIYFEAKNKAWTADLKSPGWTQLINELMANEKKLFPNDLIPLIPTVDICVPRAPSTDERPMRPIPRRTNFLGDASKTFQLPPMRVPENAQGNGLTLPSLAGLVSSANRGPLQSSSAVNQPHSGYDGHFYSSANSIPGMSVFAP